MATVGYQPQPKGWARLSLRCISIRKRADLSFLQHHSIYLPTASTVMSSLRETELSTATLAGVKCLIRHQYGSSEHNFLWHVETRTATRLYIHQKKTRKIHEQKQERQHANKMSKNITSIETTFQSKECGRLLASNNTGTSPSSRELDCCHDFFRQATNHC